MANMMINQAKALIQEQENIDHEYLAITGLADFTKASPKLIFGPDSDAIKENRWVDLHDHRLETRMEDGF